MRLDLRMLGSGRRARLRGAVEAQETVEGVGRFVCCSDAFKFHTETTDRVQVSKEYCVL